MVNNSGQLYTIEGIAAGILMLTTAYLVMSTTSIYTPAETHISDMQLEQLGNDVLSAMGTPHSSEFSYSLGENKSELAQYIEKNQTMQFAVRFNDLVTQKGAGNIKFYSTVYYRNATGIIQPLPFTNTGDIGATSNSLQSSAGWRARTSHSSVAMPDGSIVLMGGLNGSIYLSDVWRSTDNGASWKQMTAGAAWAPRASFSAVAMQDGSIVLMGGLNSSGILKNDVWRSTDSGATWTQMTAGAAWSPRASFSAVEMQDGSIVLMGGNDGSPQNDVWISTDKGATWTQKTAGAAWSTRSSFSTVVMPDRSIVLMGGDAGGPRNDVWRSMDNGASWAQMTAGAAWSPRASFSAVASPDGSIVLMGGDAVGFKNDVWRSMDDGATWTQTKPNDITGWTARASFSSVMVPVPPGNLALIILMGGQDSTGPNNDVWSSISRPTITNRERMVTVSRLVQIDPTKFDPSLPFDHRNQTVLMEVSLWRA